MARATTRPARRPWRSGGARTEGPTSARGGRAPCCTGSWRPWDPTLCETRHEVAIVAPPDGLRALQGDLRMNRMADGAPGAAVEALDAWMRDPAQLSRLVRFDPEAYCRTTLSRTESV